MKFYSLYDCKADGFTPPFIAKNDEMAKRTIIDTVHKIGDCQLTQYPEDFTLFALGEWNEDLGEIKPFACNLAVATVKQLLFHDVVENVGMEESNA